MIEKREIKQEKIYDENGNLQYTIIPNYVKNDEFMTKSEIRFYKFLINVVAEIKEEKNIKIQIFPQVALNRIIRQNNRREKELEKDLFGKSIDYVLYNLDTDNIICCIELDGPEHKTNEERIKRDKIVENALKNTVLLIRQDINNTYDKEKYINYIEKIINN